MSKDIGIFLLSSFKILFILVHSLFSFIGLDPGLVDSPPTSIKFAPELNKFIACLIALFFLLNFPPSEKLSGVKFKTPKKLGIRPNFKLQKLFFFEVIFFKSKLIFFLTSEVIF